jgi:predicted nuclease of predicted toxin-antitoxin system
MVVYATARALDGIVWTQDSDFEKLPHVRYWPKLR